MFSSPAFCRLFSSALPRMKCYLSACIPRGGIKDKIQGRFGEPFEERAHQKEKCGFKKGELWGRDAFKACLLDRFHHLASTFFFFFLQTLLWWHGHNSPLSLRFSVTHMQISCSPPLHSPTHTHSETSYPSHTNKHTIPTRLPIPALTRRLFFFDRVKLSGKWRGNDTGHIFTNLPCWHTPLWHRACQQPVSSV